MGAKELKKSTEEFKEYTSLSGWSNAFRVKSTWRKCMWFVYP